MLYLDEGFYRYLIGRPGQSVNEATMVKRWDHQMLVTKEIFKAHDLEALKKKNPKLARYMNHELALMMTIATVFTRLNYTDEAEAEFKKLWAEAYALYPKTARRMRWRSIAFFVCFPGKLGRSLSIFFYRFAIKWWRLTDAAFYPRKPIFVAWSDCFAALKAATKGSPWMGPETLSLDSARTRRALDPLSAAAWDARSGRVRPAVGGRSSEADGPHGRF